MKRISCFSVLRLRARYGDRRTGQTTVKTPEKYVGKKIGMERHTKSRLATNDSVKQGFKM